MNSPVRFVIMFERQVIGDISFIWEMWNVEITKAYKSGVI